MKTVTFLFPRSGEIPIGGFKVVYEYANRLAGDGYVVNVVYGIISRPVKNPFLRFGYYCWRTLRWMKYLLFKDYKPQKWFNTDERINHLLRFSLSEQRVPDSDVFIATSWTTAVWLNQYKRISNENKFYLIQHFEDWHGSYNEVIETWKMKLNKIVIAPWLQKIAEDLGEESILIENGFDQDAFYITTPIQQKDKYTAIMLWHDHPFKSCDVGLKSLMLVKEKKPEFKAIFFGVPDRPSMLPDWITYYQMPSSSKHLEIYNSASIFVGPSSMEGFCLTPPEAMLCGCAVACTNIGGYTVVAKDEITALLSEPSDSVGLSENIIRLVENDELRFEIASNGSELIKTFIWEKSYEKLLNAIKVQ